MEFICDKMQWLVQWHVDAIARKAEKILFCCTCVRARPKNGSNQYLYLLSAKKNISERNKLLIKMVLRYYKYLNSSTSYITNYTYTYTYYLVLTSHWQKSTTAYIWVEYATYVQAGRLAGSNYVEVLIDWLIEHYYSVVT